MLEYWRPKILFSIAIGIGIPLLLDDARAKEVSRKLVDPKGEPRKKQIYVPKNKNKDHKVIQDDVVIRPGPSYTNNPEGHVSPPDLVDVVPQTQPEYAIVNVQGEENNQENHQSHQDLGSHDKSCDASFHPESPWPLRQ
ncbi:hypothetical protein JHK87_035391 [Glycine soja]|nr:hypothetical protein JHK87_035391 [Glycine soja]